MCAQQSTPAGPGAKPRLESPTSPTVTSFVEEDRKEKKKKEGGKKNASSGVTQIGDILCLNKKRKKQHWGDKHQCSETLALERQIYLPCINQSTKIFDHYH